jgi:hypothetical protein
VGQPDDLARRWRNPEAVAQAWPPVGWLQAFSQPSCQTNPIVSEAPTKKVEIAPNLEVLTKHLEHLIARFVTKPGAQLQEHAGWAARPEPLKKSLVHQQEENLSDVYPEH